MTCPSIRARQARQGETFQFLRPTPHVQSSPITQSLGTGSQWTNKGTLHCFYLRGAMGSYSNRNKGQNQWQVVMELWGNGSAPFGVLELCSFLKQCTHFYMSLFWSGIYFRFYLAKMITRHGEFRHCEVYLAALRFITILCVCYRNGCWDDSGPLWRIREGLYGPYWHLSRYLSRT